MVIGPVDSLRFHELALDLRARRQALLASNIANADTPNFKARDIDFRAALEGALAGRAAGGELALVRTALRHFDAAAPGSAVASAASLRYRVPVQASIDGNTVEMDIERAQFARNAMHYEANLTLLGMEIRKMLAAIQG